MASAAWSVPDLCPQFLLILVRVLNAGNELETYKYPAIGDKIYFQNSYSDIRERAGRDGQPFLIITTETTYKNQNGDLLCITRASTIRR